MSMQVERQGDIVNNGVQVEKYISFPNFYLEDLIIIL